MKPEKAAPRQIDYSAAEKEYLNHRVDDQKDWYSQRATYNKKMFMSFQTVIIILGAIIPVWVLISELCGWDTIDGLVSAIISMFISILAGLDKLFKPQENWFNYRSNEEMIKKESWFYKLNAGPYNGKTKSESMKLFVENIESIISADIARTFKGEKQTEDEADDSIPPASPELTEEEHDPNSPKV